MICYRIEFTFDGCFKLWDSFLANTKGRELAESIAVQRIARKLKVKTVTLDRIKGDGYSWYLDDSLCGFVLIQRLELKEGDS